jgi:tRNA(Ile)-lysidine synthase
VRRYRDRLYAEAPAAGALGWSAADWRPGEAFDLGSLGRLELQPADGSGPGIARLPGPLRVEPRPAGALFEPAGSAHRRELRKWLQERGVLPWRRASLPCRGSPSSWMSALEVTRPHTALSPGSGGKP